MSELLTKQVSDKREELRKVRFGGTAGKSKDVKQQKKLRHDIARLLTTAKHD